MSRFSDRARATGNEVIIYEKEFDVGYVYYLEEKRDKRSLFHSKRYIKRKKELIVPTG